MRRLGFDYLPGETNEELWRYLSTRNHVLIEIMIAIQTYLIDKGMISYLNVFQISGF